MTAPFVLCDCCRPKQVDRAQAALAVLGDVNVTQAERDVAAQEAADAVGLLSLPASWRVEP